MTDKEQFLRAVNNLALDDGFLRKALMEELVRLYERLEEKLIQSHNKTTEYENIIHGKRG